MAKLREQKSETGQFQQEVWQTGSPLTWTSAPGPLPAAGTDSGNAASPPPQQRSAGCCAQTGSPPPGRQCHHSPAHTRHAHVDGAQRRSSRRMRARLHRQMFATCSWKRSPWLQVTDSLSGSSSLVWYEQGGRGLSSTLNSDWLIDSRWNCRTSCRTESCCCSLTGEQAVSHQSERHRQWSRDLSATLTYPEPAAAPSADGTLPPPAPSAGQADGHMTAVHSGPC